MLTSREKTRWLGLRFNDCSDGKRPDWADRSVEADAADYLLHVDAVAAVHPRGDEVWSREGVAGVIAHPVVSPVGVRVGESLGQLPVGLEALPAIVGKSGECLVLDIGGVVAPIQPTHADQPGRADGNCGEEL